MNLLPTGLYDVGLYGACLGATLRLREDPDGMSSLPRQHAQRWPRATLMLMLVVAIPTTLQFAFPALLDVFKRDPSRFADGQWWRLVTPLVVQDGGIGGSLFNLVTLLFLGSAAERVLGSVRCIAIFLIGGIVSEAIAFAWQPLGAGNSVANFALAGSLAIACLCSAPPRLARAIALFAVGADGWLLLLKDIHGAGALVGIALGASFLGLDRARRPRPH